MEALNTIDTEFLTLKDVAVQLTISARQVLRLVSRGEFPRPMKIGRLNRWAADDVKEFKAKLKSQR